MDISYLSKDKYKIKAKTGTVETGAQGLTISHKSGGEDFLITGAGEYEVEGISVFGYQAEEQTVYVIQFDDVRVLYLGDLTKPLTQQVVDDLESIDVVIMSADTMEVKDLVEVVTKLEPYYILPYGAQVDKFITSYEHGSRAVKSFALSKTSLPDDLTEVIVFE